MNGVLVYGEEAPKLEPGPDDPDDPGTAPASIKVLYRCGTPDSAKNTIRSAISIMNTGTVPVNLSDIKVRYWFTSDGNQDNSFACDYAAFGAEKVTGNFFSINNPVSGADTCCEIGFTNAAGKLAPGGSTGTIPFRIQSNSAYDQTNDYSYDSSITGDPGENHKITAYVKGSLKYGIEPIVTGIIPGDIDGSGSVDAIDFAIMRRYLLGSIELDQEAYSRADVNGDEAVNALDFALLRMYLLGTITSFPASR